MAYIVKYYFRERKNGDQKENQEVGSLPLFCEGSISRESTYITKHLMFSLLEANHTAATHLFTPFHKGEEKLH